MCEKDIKHIIVWPSIFLQISGFVIGKIDFTAGCVLFSIGIAGAIAYLILLIKTT